MLLILARHAETEANLKKELQGHLETPLSNRGIEQAHRLAQRLKNKKIDCIYSSDLLRARHTAEIILGTRNIPLVLTDKLRERCYGIYQGKSVTEFDRDYKSSGLSREEFCPQEGESYLNVEQRVNHFLQELFAEHENDTILLVAHSGTNRILMKKFLNKSFIELFDIGQDNTCINEIEYSSVTGWVNPLTINCTKHLTSEMFIPLGKSE